MAHLIARQHYKRYTQHFLLSLRLLNIPEIENIGQGYEVMLHALCNIDVHKSSILHFMLCHTVSEILTFTNLEIQFCGQYHGV